MITDAEHKEIVWTSFEEYVVDYYYDGQEYVAPDKSARVDKATWLIIFDDLIERWIVFRSRYLGIGEYTNDEYKECIRSKYTYRDIKRLLK